MRILCMPQAFKGSLSAYDAAQAMVEGVLSVAPDAEAIAMPVADGGDDTLNVLVTSTKGQLFEADVLGPRLEPVRAGWGVLGDGETAVIEMASASGIRLLPVDQRDPRVTTTYGTGQLILAALDAGYRRILVGVGGSATVDIGTGAATALGARFLDQRGDQLRVGGAALVDLAEIDLSGMDARLGEASISVACDVDMTLCGPMGASVFSPQKGASPEVVAELERAIGHVAGVVEAQLGVRIADLPKGGPAGGLSAGLHAFMGAELELGAHLVLRTIDATSRIPEAGLVIVGEGMMDRTTFKGKGPSVVASQAMRAGVPVIAVVGRTGPGIEEATSWGIRHVEQLVDHADLETAAESQAREIVPRATAAALRRYLGQAPPTV